MEPIPTIGRTIRGTGFAKAHAAADNFQTCGLLRQEAARRLSQANQPPQAIPVRNVNRPADNPVTR